ncbi:hypothetical protein GCM10028796_04970 [Ramlibacter monticola]|uniref:Uncharacterized protein n=1 Tax=Ramlibacter monticola TaxID=1926872 RepID=A0A936YXK5_9BURK|nr:hypothetical protein [Ramlibacter monticola]MBL0391224.1 hypothetical protein [Ramlibacter monticola]
MALTASARKLLFTAHLVSSLGWVGALAVFLAHGLVSLWTADHRVVQALSIAMAATAWLVILPLSVASFITGSLQALTTAWGLLRHYWVVFKLALTMLATGVLLMKLGPISMLGEQALVSNAAEVSSELRLSLAVHAAAGLVVLLAATLLAVYKPRGLTRIGGRREGREVGPAPTWVRISSGVALAFAVALIFMVALGSHGPGMHVRH